MLMTKIINNPGKKIEVLGSPSLHVIREAAKHAYDVEHPLRYAFFGTYFGTLKTRITKIDECKCYICKIEADVLDFSDNVIAKIKMSVNTALANETGSKGLIEYC